MVDATMYFSGTELTYSAEIVTPIAIKTVNEKPIGSGMFEVSIVGDPDTVDAPAPVTQYMDGEVRLTAMNPDGLSASQTFKVRRNKKPGEGAGVLSTDADNAEAATIGTSAEDDANVLSVAITKSVTEMTGGNDS